MMEWEKYGIDLSKVRGGKGFCPQCHGSRKHQHDRSLSVEVHTGLFHCHHCGFKGCAMKRERRERKEWVKPQARLQKVSDDVVNWFSTRGISNNTLLRAGVTEAWEVMPQTGMSELCICFNYVRNGELVNIKFRDAKKNFKMNSGSELVFFNLDSISDDTEAIIVEGEMDCLTNIECGVHNTVSVPNGASKSSNAKLEYLDNCWEWFEKLDRIIIATDNDEAGNDLREELARRLGYERCLKVTYPEGCKDSNEVMLKHGAQAVKDMYANATPFPVKGVLALEDVFDDVMSMYQHGFPPGIKTRIPGFDDYFTFNTEMGHLIIVTGIPGHGKSEFVDLVMANMAKYYDWRWAVWAFETQPVKMHIGLLAEKIGGKTIQYRVNPEHRLTQDEFENALGIIDEHFFFPQLDDEDVDLTIDGILAKCRELVKSKGIKGVVIDPWNYVESKQGSSVTETQYINDCLTKIKLFCRKTGVHVILIAHPTKMQKQNGVYDVPTLYSVSGSAHFFNKADDGWVVYRWYESGKVDVHNQKIKRSWLGKLGMVSYLYDTLTRQYKPIQNQVSNWNGIVN